MEKKKVIVTGCMGQLGRAIGREFASDEAYELINTDVNADISLDITDIDKVMDFVRSTKPQAVINCAAYTAVDKQEDDRDLSMKINAIGPRNLAIAAREAGAKLVHISTDYVTAVKVGSRHGKPVVLRFRAADFVRDGYKLYISDNGVWQTEYVPPEYLSVLYADPETYNGTN